jgi:hypothetical protein
VTRDVGKKRTRSVGNATYGIEYFFKHASATSVERRQLVNAYKQKWVVMIYILLQIISILSDFAFHYRPCWRASSLYRLSHFFYMFLIVF